MRSASGARVGDGGGTTGPGATMTPVAAVRWNETTDTAGAIASALPSVRSTPGPAANASGPEPQQSSQVPTRRACEVVRGDAFACAAGSAADAP